MLRTILLVLLVAALVGCGASDTCAKNPASCQDAGNGTCTGQCTPLGLGFDVMLWSGPPGSTAPACPTFANGGIDQGFLDTPPSKVTCSSCSCEPSGNECYLPSTMTASTAACPAAAGAPFDAPATWNGSCTAMDPVSSAASLTVDPPMLAGPGSCAASTASVTGVEGVPNVAITCQSIPFSHFGDVEGECPSENQWCAYPNVPGFTVCTAAAGPGTCPAGWTNEHTFYFASCACSCGDAMGELCSTTVTAYEDGTCSQPVASVSVTSNDNPMCADVAAASPLGSKTATVTYTPGMCAPTQTMVASNTLCCLE